MKVTRVPKLFGDLVEGDQFEHDDDPEPRKVYQKVKAYPDGQNAILLGGAEYRGFADEHNVNKLCDAELTVST